ncbi:MAG: tRNA (adenosine(37)-N6)-dimethylallyltransferase MiaA [Acidimicrobiia bacterium]|nr:tRNA (adenosine(37)-N6)-dimethylallyltransferase MiaA [Acidimicrobiia bacterium]
MSLARRFGAHIVSVDSMQVYRGMDVGTAKPSVEERATVPHHLVDIADPADAFSVAEFQRAGRTVIAAARAAGERILIVGGSGLHFRALVDPLDFPPSDPAVRAEIEALTPSEAVGHLLAADAEVASLVDLANPRRVVRALEVFRTTGATPSARAATPEAEAIRSYRGLWPVVGIGVDPGPALGERIRQRFAAMLAAGLQAEVESLAPRLGVTASQGVGYRELLKVVRGEWTLDRATRTAIEATLALARRQRTFYRRDPRVRWLEWDDEAALVAKGAALLEEAGWTS